MNKILEKINAFDLSKSANQFKIKNYQLIQLSVRGLSAVNFINQDLENGVCTNFMPFAVANIVFGYDEEGLFKSGVEVQSYSESLMNFVFDLNVSLVGLTFNEVLDKIINFFKMNNYPINRDEITIAIMTSTVFHNTKVKLKVNYEFDSDDRYFVNLYLDDIILQLNLNNNIIDSQGNIMDGCVPLVPIKNSVVLDSDDENNELYLEIIYEYPVLFKKKIIYTAPLIVSYEWIE